MEFGCIVLAAGASKRMGYPKLTSTLCGKTVLEHVLEKARSINFAKRVAVLGASSDDVLGKVDFAGFLVFVNPEYSKGISGSLKIGLKALRMVDAAVVLLGDVPFVTVDTITRLMAEHERTRPALTVPVHRGRRGNPVVIDMSVLSLAEDLTGDRGASQLLSKVESILFVEVSDEGIYTDIDTPEDLLRAASLCG
jgi:molybdenum cofactor cytidylyltransferase